MASRRPIVQSAGDAQQLQAGDTLSLPGSSSGSTDLRPAAAASGTITLPAATDTVVCRNTADTLTNKTLTSPVVNGVVTGTAQVYAVLAANATTSSTAQADVTGLSFPIGANETWIAEFVLSVSSTAAGAGGKYQFTGPASPTTVLAEFFGTGSGATSFIADPAVTAFSSPSSVYCAQNGGGILRINLTVVNGANPGTVQLQNAVNSSGTHTVKAGGSMVAIRQS